MFPILIQIGPFVLHTYGLMVAIGFLLALTVARRQFQRFGLPLDRLDPMVLYLMIFGLLGARALYFALESSATLRVDPFAFFRLWEGGLVFYGAVIAGVLTLTVLSRRYGVRFISLTDAFAAPLLLGHALGRVGCFAAGCCYGRPTELPWGVSFSHPASLAPRFTPLHPTQLYESAGNLLLFFAALWLSRRERRPGMLTAFYAVSYGLFRFLVEFLRGDDRGFYFHRFSPSQIVAAALVMLGMLVFFHAKKESAR